ncbi:nucleotidyltransferase family protein [Tunicatimonas pelagia]|uniref:nucleotidyltransferase family protein n=1 Tax=Tunicatimonas pelagia TaxID=931531 RepID=UPI00266657E4|nr:nucleotidyltransferase domain-containing protein [Tunicatimonas pelagia]WKN45899.1 nucleotidyltransferase domain-containing protein [Tunicatimonas pelagia]
MKLIEKHIKEIKHICEQHHVDKMYVFGSVLTNSFSVQSDIDFLVKFGKVNPFDYFDNYMSLKESMMKLFDRNIDLVEVQTLKNPILKRAIDRNKVLIYGRENIEVAV